MINSLFMLGSSYSRNRIISSAFIVGWIVYMVIGNINYSLGIFPIINGIVFLLVSVSINILKNKKVNTVLSVCSILIWSIIIDIICYYLYPLYSSNQNIVGYIWQGILFNYKYIFSNIIAVCLINVFDYIIEYIKTNVKKQVEVA